MKGYTHAIDLATGASSDLGVCRPDHRLTELRDVFRAASGVTCAAPGSRQGLWEPAGCSDNERDKASAADC